MGSIYIGSQRNKKSGGSMWKLYLFLFLFFVVTGAALKMSAPMLVEEWINRKGAEATGYAFSIRDVDLSFGKGQMILNDVKVFNPETSAKLMEAPTVTIQLDLQELLLSQDKKFSVFADKVDLILSKDFSSEMKRIQAANDKQKEHFYLDAVEGKIVKLNIIEQKEDLSRTVIELNDVNVKVKELSLLSINKKTEFSVTSNIADGGKLNLTGKTKEENGKTPWTINGTLKKVPSDIFNKMAGDKLPFSFNESSLNAEIVAHSERGEVSGEITPEIRKLNLIDEKPGVPTQTVARILNEELTFTLPFTLKDELTLQYADTYRKLKTYRKYPAAETEAPTEAKVTQNPKAKKSSSFWPF